MRINAKTVFCVIPLILLEDLNGFNLKLQKYDQIYFKFYKIAIKKRCLSFFPELESLTWWLIINYSTVLQFSFLLIIYGLFFNILLSNLIIHYWLFLCPGFSKIERFLSSTFLNMMNFEVDLSLRNNCSIDLFRNILNLNIK